MEAEKLLLNAFQEDFNKSAQYTYQSQLAVIVIKSLVPMINEEAIRIDYKRFLEEYKLWNNYRIGENSSLLNAQGGVNPNVYWQDRDDSLIYRIIPLIVANKNYKFLEEEVIKNILFTTGNLQSLYETISIAALFNMIIEKESNPVDKFKEIIIGFSQREFLERYTRFYRVDINQYMGNFKAEFEREKISLLNILHGMRSNKYEIVEELIDIIENNQPHKTYIGKILYDYINNETDYNISKFHRSMGDYLTSLRKSRIDPNKLIIKDYKLPDVFSFNEGDMFFHSLLKEAKVIKKEVKDGILTSLIQTKTGIYLFKKR